jgi:osmotically-inducible protein OsmY
MRGFAVPFMAKTWATVLLTACVAMAQTNAPAQGGAKAPQQAASQQGTAQQNLPAQTASQQGTSGQPAPQPNPAATPVSASSSGTPGNSANAQSSQPADLDLNRNPADRALEKQVVDQFAHKAEFQNVRISVNGGVVTLEGSVPTKIEKRQAKALARGVNGVKKVQEHLTVTGAGVAGPGTFANTTTTAQNQPAANTGAPASTPAGSATAQTSETTAGGGTSGMAMNTAPPSSNVGAGASTNAPLRTVTSKPNASAGQNTFGLTTVDPASLASKINTALKNDPTLAKNNVMVNVSDQGVEVTGSVDTGKEKVTAMRIAQSYAGNFKVVDRLTLAGRAPAPNVPRQTPTPTEANSSTPPSPRNVVGNQVLPPNTAQNTRDPKTAGDKSNNPR